MDSVTFERTMFSLPPDVELKFVDPPNVNIEWQDVVTRTIPIQAARTGQPAKGYEVADAMDIDPKEISIKGPSSLVEVLQFARLAAFDTTGLTEGVYRRRLAIDDPPSRVRYLGPPSATVTVTVVRRQTQVKFERRPVEVVGSPHARVTPAVVDVTVSGPPRRRLRPARRSSRPSRRSLDGAHSGGARRTARVRDAQSASGLDQRRGRVPAAGRQREVVEVAHSLAERPSSRDTSRMDLSPAVAEILASIPDVRAVYVFGSVASGTSLSESDVDLAILGPRKLGGEERFRLQERIAQKIGRSVDLVDLLSASTVMRVEVLRTAEILRDTDPAARARFEGKALADYARLNELRSGILADVKNRGSVHG